MRHVYKSHTTMQRTLVPISATPAEFIVPEQYAGNLEYTPIGGDPLRASTILPTMYLFDPNRARDLKWIFDYEFSPPPAQITGAKVYVRLFDEDQNKFWLWHEGVFPIPETSRRLFQGQIQKPSGTDVTVTADDYRHLRLCLNLVYIPILTNTRGMWPNKPERDRTVVYYTGQVLWVSPTWTEYHVCVLNGPYTALVMRSLHVCAFTGVNAAAIENAPDGCVFDRLPGPLTKAAMLHLPVRSTNDLKLPVGHAWTTRDELKRRGLIEGNLKQRDRAKYVRAEAFEELAEHDVNPEWYDGSG
ncbi:hypothetical protein B0H21DRAFT_827092 [Amylocystis lapponica]|nr:hypothetical protein B0H21DRAFT_827092 [Amylocystis lapponica]